jgi:hypothetical protein
MSLINEWTQIQKGISHRDFQAAQPVNMHISPSHYANGSVFDDGWNTRNPYPSQGGETENKVLGTKLSGVIRSTAEVPTNVRAHTTQRKVQYIARKVVSRNAVSAVGASFRRPNADTSFVQKIQAMR